MIVEVGTTAKYFNLTEARELVSLVRTLTEQHQRQLEPIQQRLNKMLSNDPRRPKIDADFERVVSRWKSKIEKLGPHVRGLWLVEFDVGSGYLSWQYPDYGINFFRESHAPLTQRVRLTRYIEDVDPDWA